MNQKNQTSNDIRICQITIFLGELFSLEVLPKNQSRKNCDLTNSNIVRVMIFLGINSVSYEAAIKAQTNH